MRQRIATIIVALTAGIAAIAQTLNVEMGQVTYQVPATQAGEMTYNNGQTLTILGKEFNLSDISCIYIDNSEVTDNTVAVAYDGTSATPYR